MQDGVDVSSLLLLRQLQPPNKPDAVARIVSLFLKETEERLTALRRAADVGDAVALEQAAHALKGIAGTVGANDVHDLAVRLERLGRDGRTEGAADLVTELELSVGRARPVFDRLRQDVA